MQALMLSALATLTTPTPALACGGFFCAQVPVDQSGENIVFAIDTDDRTVETHVQINYEGAAEEFAWVVPVSEVPEIFVSTETLFDTLLPSTQPSWSLERNDQDCESSWWGTTSTSGTTGTGTGTGGYSGDLPEVRVEFAKKVGPYETVVLTADSSDALVQWLIENDFDVPYEIGEVLDPYVANDAAFVALKLASDQDAGDIVPLGLRYSGTRASIPIQLTSVAATEDMRLRVWVFGDERAVPENYLHVVVNELHVDWERLGANYEDVVSEAADEAGGQAFATDFAGSPDFMAGSLYREGQFDTELLASKAHPVKFIDEVFSQGFPSDDALLNLLSTYLPPPPDVDADDFFNCLRCYPDQIDTSVWDAVALAADLEELFVEPLRHADRLFTDYPWMTRMVSSMSPVEMTADPIFVFNPDMGEVSHQRTAVLDYRCSSGQMASEGRRNMLAQRNMVAVPSEEYLRSLDQTLHDYLRVASPYAALMIEQTGASGQPEVLVDNTRDVLAGIELAYQDYESWSDTRSETCGCSSSSASAAPVWLVLLAGLRWRRRQTA